MKKAKEGIIQTQPSYPDTLKAIPIGQSRRFKAHARIVNGMRNASHRLSKAGLGKWRIELIDDQDVLVTRTA